MEPQHLRRFFEDPTEAQFRPVYEATKDLVYTICYRTLGNADDASDALQGAYGRLFLIAGDPAAQAELKEWDAAQTMRRLAYLEADRIRKIRSRRNRKEQPMDEINNPATGPGARRNAEAAELRDHVMREIESLPEVYRTILSLHLLHELNHREIAETMDISINTVSTRIRRGSEKLRERMRALGYNEKAFMAAIAGTGGLLAAPASAESTYACAKAWAAGNAAVGTSVAVTGASIMKSVLVLCGAIIIVGMLATGTVSNFLQQAPVDASENGKTSQKENVAVLPAEEGVEEIDGPKITDGSTTTPSDEVALTIQVVDAESGVPVPGANVSLSSANRAPLNAVADASGEADFAIAPDAEDVTVTGSIGSRTAGIQTQAPYTTMTLTLEIDTRPLITGRVLNEAGEPVLTTVAAGEVQGVTDTEGAFSLNLPAPGDVSLGLILGEESPYIPTNNIAVKAHFATDTCVPDFIVKEGDVIEGTVSDMNGAPIPGAQINAMTRIPDAQENESRIRTGVTNEYGHYRISGLLPGTIADSMRVTHPDFKLKTVAKVNPLDSPHDFVLERDGKVLLVAVDEDEKPITDYRYRVFRMTYYGFDHERDYMDQAVSHPRGETILSQFQQEYTNNNTRYRIEAAQSGVAREEALRGAIEFDLVVQEDGEPMKVLVQLNPPVSLTGRVMERGSANPLEGVRVIRRPIRDSWMHGIYPPNDFFDPEPAISAADGSFELSYVFPGEFKMALEKEGMIPAEVMPVFQVPYDAPPAPVEVYMMATGTIHGRLHRNGKPAAEELVHIEAYDPQGKPISVGKLGELGRAITDAEGRYAFPNLYPAVYTVSLENPRFGWDHKMKRVTLEPGSTQVVDFDLGPGITLKGEITGAHAATMICFMPEDGGQRIWLNRDGNSYTAELAPGRYMATAIEELANFYYIELFPGLSGGIISEFEVAESPEIQEQDFHVDLVRATVVADTPGGIEFPKGFFELSQRTPDGRRDRVLRATLEQSRHYLGLLPPGEYIGDFRSQDSEVFGSTGWVTVEEGEEAILPLIIRAPFRVRLGGWTPEDLARDDWEVRFDITQHMTTPGEYEIVADYERGQNAVFCRGAAILANGSITAEDNHHALLGATEIGATYKLPIESTPPGVRYEALVRMRIGTADDSYGSIYLVRR